MSKLANDFDFDGYNATGIGPDRLDLTAELAAAKAAGILKYVGDPARENLSYGTLNPTNEFYTTVRTTTQANAQTAPVVTDTNTLATSSIARNETYRFRVQRNKFYYKSNSFDTNTYESCYDNKFRDSSRCDYYNVSRCDFDFNHGFNKYLGAADCTFGGFHFRNEYQAGLSASTFGATHSRNKVGANCYQLTLGRNITGCTIGDGCAWIVMGDNCANVVIESSVGTSSAPITIPAGSTDVYYKNGVLVADRYNIAGKLDKANNLSDLQDKTAARQNLGVGPALTYTPEDAANKVGNLSTPSATTYPTTQAVVAGLTDKAPLASPAFTGTPTAPTPGDADSAQALVTKAYVATQIGQAATDAYRPAGNYDASAGTFPTAGTGAGGAVRRGDTYKVSVAGTIGGMVLDKGDTFYAVVANPGQVATNWDRFEYNTEQATEALRGTVALATTAEAQDETNGASDSKVITPKKLWLGFAKLLAAARTAAEKWTFSKGLSAGTAKITDVATGTAATDAANVGQLFKPIITPFSLTGTDKVVVVNHALGRPAATRVYDAAGNELLPTVVNTDANTTTIAFGRTGYSGNIHTS